MMLGSAPNWGERKHFKVFYQRPGKVSKTQSAALPKESGWGNHLKAPIGSEPVFLMICPFSSAEGKQVKCVLIHYFSKMDVQYTLH